MKPRDPKKARDTRALQDFVDAMRGVLRLPPLYRKGDERSDVERFGARFVVDGIGRGVASGRPVPPHWV